MEPSRSSYIKYRGVTLVELLVVLAIIAILTVVTITSQSAFNKTIILANTAYDVALSIRSAETFGLGNRLVGTASNAGYGVHFQKSPKNSFTLFIDSDLPSSSNLCHPLPIGGVYAPDSTPGNCVYGGSDVSVGNNMLGNGITIDDFCAYTTYNSAGASCAKAHSGTLTSLDITFSRPNTRSFFGADGTYDTTDAAYTVACLTLTSPQGNFRYVHVEQTGAITANSAVCP